MRALQLHSQQRDLHPFYLFDTNSQHVKRRENISKGLSPQRENELTAEHDAEA